MILPFIFAGVGIAGGRYGLYQYFTRPRCPKCRATLKITKNVCKYKKCGFERRLD